MNYIISNSEYDRLKINRLTGVQAMKNAGKEPFPAIYVDPKPESEAAKSGAKYEIIAKVNHNINNLKQFYTLTFYF